MSKKKILVVDDNQANLIACKKTLKDLYDVFPVPSTDKMFDILNHVIPDLILLDVEMPGTNGYEAIQILKGHDDHKDIPVIFLSAMDDSQSEIEGLSLGAVDYIHKPFVSALLIRRIQSHLAVIEGRKKLTSLNKFINELLTPKANEDKPNVEAAEEALKMLLAKGEILSRMGHSMRAPLNTIIYMIETAMKADDIDKIKHQLGKADTEARLILEILNDILDTSKNG